MHAASMHTMAWSAVTPANRRGSLRPAPWGMDPDNPDMHRSRNIKARII